MDLRPRGVPSKWDVRRVPLCSHTRVCIQPGLWSCLPETPGLWVPYSRSRTFSPSPLPVGHSPARTSAPLQKRPREAAHVQKCPWLLKAGVMRP